MKIIGITGGVGSGKSMVLEYLHERYGVPVIQADLVGHEVMEPGFPAYDRIRSEFGDGILDADGRIDRKKLGGIVFADQARLQILNSIIHPEVKTEILRRLRTYEEEGYVYAAVEAALFLEENYGAFCDETWYIDTSEEIRRKRLKESRGYTDGRIDQILRAQLGREEYLARCQVVIENNGTAQELKDRIDKRMRQ